MKTFLTFLSSSILACSMLAQAPDFVWAKRIGDHTTPYMGGPVVALDAQGNRYQVGQDTGPTFTLDGITISTSSPSVSKGYIAKYDPNGQIIWAKSTVEVMTIGTAQNVYNFNKLLVDGQGNIYFCGQYNYNSFHNPAYIGNDLITDPVVSENIQSVRYNTFLAKLDANGNLLWFKRCSRPVQGGGSYGISGPTEEIFFDLEGNINMTGPFYNYISFTPGDTLRTTDVNTVAMFLAKYSPSGEVLQNRKLEGGVYPRNKYGTEHVRADASGKLYRWSNQGGVSGPPRQLFRYDAQGELLDSLNIAVSVSNTPYYCRLNSFAVSPSGDVFIGGYFFGNLILEGTTYNGYGNDKTDAVIFKLSAPDYNIDWVRRMSTSYNDQFSQLLTDGIGNIYATGQTQMGSPQSIGFRKYTSDGALLWDLPVGVGSQFCPHTLTQSPNGGNILLGGFFRHKAIFPNVTFTAATPQDYNGFLAQYGLCNTVNPSIDTPASTKLCGEESLTLTASLNTPGLTYFWSTPTGKVAIGSTETTAALTVTQPGKYYLVAQEDAECYGKSQEIWVTQVPLPDNGATEQNNILTATETTQGTAYQWLDCDNGATAINGATGVSFTPVQNGNYAVRVTSPAGCSDTSACLSVSTLAIDKKTDLEQLISIYPNPAKDEINIECMVVIKSVRILDLQGKELMRTKGDKVTISSLPTGVYLIEIRTPKGVGVKRFVKE